MKQSKNILEAISIFFLDKKLSKIKRNISVRNLDNTKTALIITDYLNTKDKEEIKKFLKFLRNINIDVLEVSYCNRKTSPEVSDFKDQLILTKKDFNWMGFAKSSSMEQFLGRPFNLLIDLTLEFHPQVKTIVALSKADFKVGIMPVDQKFYDFMIDLGKDRTMTRYIDQIIHYLRILKP